MLKADKVREITQEARKKKNNEEKRIIKQFLDEKFSSIQKKVNKIIMAAANDGKDSVIVTEEDFKKEFGDIKPVSSNYYIFHQVKGELVVWLNKLGYGTYTDCVSNAFNPIHLKISWYTF